MKKLQWLALLFFVLNTLQTNSQSATFSSPAVLIDKSAFFLDTSLLEMTITTDFRKLQSEHKKGIYQPGLVTMRLPEFEPVTENIRLYARGEFRRLNCRMPGLMVDFKSTDSSALSRLKKLKLTCGCASTAKDEQLLLTEYLIYRMYNLLTDKSFKVRLAKVTYKDIRQKMKEYVQYAFLLEDVDDMANRNNCMEVQATSFLTEQTNRKHMTLVALFQYMVGNTDWAVPTYHNIKLMRLKNDSLSLPYVVPYDFDFTGLVNAYYALPHPDLGIERVTERLYRGFPRTMEELQDAISIFQKKRAEIISLVTGFHLIKNKEREVMLQYIQDFYKIIEDNKDVQMKFIDGARRY